MKKLVLSALLAVFLPVSPTFANDCGWGEEMGPDGWCVPIECGWGEQLSGNGTYCETIYCDSGYEIGSDGMTCEPVDCGDGYYHNGIDCMAMEYTVYYECDMGGSYSEMVQHGTEYTISDTGCYYYDPDYGTSYTPTGWKSGNKTYKIGDTVTITGDMYFTAQWLDEPLVVTYDCGNGIVQTQELTTPWDTITPPDPKNICNLPNSEACDGYWYYNENVCEVEVDLFDGPSYNKGILSVRNYSYYYLTNGYWGGNTIIDPSGFTYKFYPFFDCKIDIDLQGGNIIGADGSSYNEDLISVGAFRATLNCPAQETLYGIALNSATQPLDSEYCKAVDGALFFDCESVQSSGITFTKNGKKFKGFNTNPLGCGKYQSIYPDTSSRCVYPECTKLYAVWEGEESDDCKMPGISIDFNGGTATNLMGDGATVSNLSLAALFGVSEEELENELHNFIDQDLWSELFQYLASDLMDIYTSGNNDVSITNSEYKLVGFSPNKDAMEINPTCVYPECHTMYAIWAPADATMPDIVVNLNGGTLNGSSAPVVIATADQIAAAGIVPQTSLREMMAELAEDWIDDNRYTIRHPDTSYALIGPDNAQKFVWFSQNPNNIDTLDCIYPQCSTLYAIWDDNPPDISIDFNGGAFFAQNGGGLYQNSGQTDALSWAWPDAADANHTYYRPQVLALLKQYAENPTDAYYLMRPKYNYVGLNTKPDGTGAWADDFETCIYPECNTLFAIWKEKEPGTYMPGIYADFNGGKFTKDGNDMYIYQIVADDMPGLEQLDGMDLWPELESMYSDVFGGGEFVRPGYTFVGFSPYDTEMVENPTCFYPDCNTVYATWSLNACPVLDSIKLSNGTTIPLAAEKTTSPTIAVRYNNQMCYIGLNKGSKNHTLNLRYRGKIYHAE